MKQIYNKATKVADLIEGSQTVPEGWTDKAPNWVEFEAWDEAGNCWSVSETLKTHAENQIKIDEARKYLSSTDWYVTRFMERKVEIPVEVSAKRLEAVGIINELEK